jgi:Arc/MetJ family transcription regulator
VRPPGLRLAVDVRRHWLARKAFGGPGLRWSRLIPVGMLDITASLHYRISMRTTVTLDDDVFQAAQSLAKASGKRLGQVLSELVRRALKSESRGFTRQGGLPVFPVSPDAAVIPASRAAELLANEPK